MIAGDTTALLIGKVGDGLRGMEAIIAGTEVTCLLDLERGVRRKAACIFIET